MGLRLLRRPDLHSQPDLRDPIFTVPQTSLQSGSLPTLLEAGTCPLCWRLAAALSFSHLTHSTHWHVPLCVRADIHRDVSTQTSQSQICVRTRTRAGVWGCNPEADAGFLSRSLTELGMCYLAKLAVSLKHPPVSSLQFPPPWYWDHWCTAAPSFLYRDSILTQVLLFA